MKIARRYKEKKKRNILITIIQIILIGCIIWSSIYIIKWLYENKKTNNMQNKIKTAVTIDKQNGYKIDFEELEKQNKDIVAWLRVNNTNVDYPVVQATNNDYYLHHSFDKTQNSAGWIFLDYKNKLDGTDKNLIIYGHNRKDGSMFGTLGKALNEEWYKNEQNQQIEFITKNEKNIYKIFSIYQIPDEDYYITTTFNNNEEYLNFLNKIKSRSIYNFNVNLDENTQILTLSTCGASNKNRVVIHAKKLQNL